MMPREFSTIELTVDDQVATIWLNRPDANNGINLQMMTEFKTAVFDLEANPAIRVVILRGRGRNFSVGGDMAMFTEAGDAISRTIADVIANFHDALLSMRRSGATYIAVVHGACAGGALSLALACDFVIADDQAKFAVAYRKLGASADGGMSHALTRALGQRHALELLLLSDTFTAADALKMGLINRLVRADALEDEVACMTTILRGNAPASVRALKALAYQAPTTSFDQQLSSELAAFAQCAGTSDFREGVRAFAERRQPAFTGA
jgi:2-(1,2-epoxy-1,2-dihydrophenyl)acetyl-CoA isomerase